MPTASACRHAEDLPRLYFFPLRAPPFPPIEVLYKKAVVLAPGYFGHVDPAHSQVHMRLLVSGIQELQKELGENKAAPADASCTT